MNNLGSYKKCSCHPKRDEIPLSIRICYEQKRLAPTRPLTEPYCLGAAKRVKTVVNRDRLDRIVGFVCGSTLRVSDVVLE